MTDRREDRTGSALKWITAPPDVEMQPKSQQLQALRTDSAGPPTASRSVLLTRRQYPLRQIYSRMFCEATSQLTSALCHAKL